MAPLDPSHQTVTLDDLRDLVNRKLRYYPQVRHTFERLGHGRERGWIGCFWIVYLVGPWACIISSCRFSPPLPFPSSSPPGQLLFFMDSIEKNFADADINKDGTLDLEEFHKLLETADHYIRALPATAQGTSPLQQPFSFLTNSSQLGGDSLEPPLPCPCFPPSVPSP